MKGGVKFCLPQMTLSDQAQGNADEGVTLFLIRCPRNLGACNGSVTAVGSNIRGNYAAEITWSNVQEQLDEPSRSNQARAPGSDFRLPVAAANDILFTDAAY